MVFSLAMPDDFDGTWEIWKKTAEYKMQLSILEKFNRMTSTYHDKGKLSFNGQIEEADLFKTKLTQCANEGEMQAMVLAMFDEYAPRGAKLSSPKMREKNNTLRKDLRWVVVELFNVQINCCFAYARGGEHYTWKFSSFGHGTPFLFLFRSLSHFAFNFSFGILFVRLF
jgi:hypothetical protein